MRIRLPKIFKGYGFRDGYRIPNVYNLRGRKAKRLYEAIMNAKPLDIEAIDKDLAENDAHLSKILANGGKI